MKRKTYTVTGHDLEYSFLPREGKMQRALLAGDDLEVSDGHHTMSEVYEHRYALFIALLNELNRFSAQSAVRVPQVWKSRHHSECQLPSTVTEGGLPCCSMFSNSFVAGIGVRPGEQITYHLPLKYFNDVKVPELQRAPEYDGHAAADVLERLRKLF